MWSIETNETIEPAFSTRTWSLKSYSKQKVSFWPHIEDWTRKKCILVLWFNFKIRLWQSYSQSPHILPLSSIFQDQFVQPLLSKKMRWKTRIQSRGELCKSKESYDTICFVPQRGQQGWHLWHRDFLIWVKFHRIF